MRVRVPPRAVIFLFVIVFLLYLPVLHGSFVYDDLWLIVRNPAIRSFDIFSFFIHPETIAAPGSGLSSDIYRPLLASSFALDYHLWELVTWPYHLENILLHGLNGFILWLLLRKILRRSDAALFGTAVFLMHPVQVQSVAWIAQRSNLLSGAGFLTALVCLLWPEKTSYRKTFAGWAAYVLALLTKEAAIVLPVVIVLLESLPRKEPLKKSARRAVIWNIGGLLAISGAYLLLRQSLLHHFSQTPESPRILWEDASLGLMAFPVYLGKMLLPLALRASYQYPLMTPGKLAWATGVWGFYGFLMVWTWQRWPLAGRSLAWILVGLAPVLQIVPIRAFVAERFLYFPMMGLAVLGGWLFSLTKPWKWGLASWLLVLAGMTAAAVFPWRDETSLWKHAVLEEPTNSFAQVCYAESITDYAEAETHYKIALANQPTSDLHFSIVNNLAWVNLGAQRPQEALIWAKQALQDEPNNTHALYNLCVAYIQLGESHQAWSVYDRLKVLTPESTDMLISLSQRLSKK